MKTNPMTNHRQPIFGCIGVATMLQERQVRAFQDPLLGGKCHQNRPQVPCLQTFGMPTGDVEINYFTFRVIPTMTFIHFLFLTGKSPGILSDISSGNLSARSSGILSGISHGILSGISSGILSDIPSGIFSGILSGISHEVRQGTFGVDIRG